MRTALYAGSFDPFTNGHLDVLLQGLNLCDRIVVAIGRHATKPGAHPFEDRAELIRSSMQGAGVPEQRFRVETFDDLVVDAAARFGAEVILRGLRDAGDLPYEMQMAGMNLEMAPDIQTVFVPALPRSRHITATLVRQIDAMGGDVKPFVPPAVLDYMQARRSRSTAPD